jgi:hypothetical protein
MNAPNGTAFSRVAVLVDAVSKQQDYRNNARDSFRLAERAASTSDKLRLLNLAEAWMSLADRAEKLASRLLTVVPSASVR